MDTVGYASGEEPLMGDKVMSAGGRRGEVYNVQLNSGNTPGQAQVAVKWEDGGPGVGNALAIEFTLISRKA
jgi:hypothetical protein